MADAHNLDAERLTLPQQLRALAGEPWPFPGPDPDFGITGNVMREAAQRIEELEAQLAGADSGTHTTNTHQPAAGVTPAQAPSNSPPVGSTGADWQAVAEMVAIDDGLGTVFVEFTAPRPPAGTKLYVQANAGVALPLKDQK